MNRNYSKEYIEDYSTQLKKMKKWLTEIVSSETSSAVVKGDKIEFKGEFNQSPYIWNYNQARIRYHVDLGITQIELEPDEFNDEFIEMLEKTAKYIMKKSAKSAKRILWKYRPGKYPTKEHIERLKNTGIKLVLKKNE